MCSYVQVTVGTDATGMYEYNEKEHNNRKWDFFGQLLIDCVHIMTLTKIGKYHITEINKKDQQKDTQDDFSIGEVKIHDQSSKDVSPKSY